MSSSQPFPERVHIMAAGGTHMSAIAQVLHARGHRVSGCDVGTSSYTDRLRRLGVPVTIGHSPEHLEGSEMLVVSAAIRDTEPELIRATKVGLPVLTRAQAVGCLMADKRGVTVAGTHGKTTTSALCTFILSRAGLDPEFMIGGDARNLGSNAGPGTGPHVVVEADEYADAFLHYRPQVAVLLNVEPDHLDYFGSMEHIRSSFRRYLANVPKGGMAIVCADDPEAAALIARRADEPVIKATIERYGLRGGDVDWSAHGLKPNEMGGFSFVATRHGRELAAFDTRVPGEHNVLNSLAGIAVGSFFHIPIPVLKVALAEFRGVVRRFEMVGEARGVLVVDDFAHHPTEVAALLKAARTHFPGRRLVILFQPHTYTRTAYLFDAFTRCFEAADACFILETYGARETPEEGRLMGRSAQELAKNVTHPIAVYLAGLECLQRLTTFLDSGDMLLTVGAGDVHRAGPLILGELRRSQVVVTSRLKC